MAPNFVNYKNGVIIEFLAKCPHNDPQTYRKIIHNARDNNARRWTFHDHTKWISKPVDELFVDIWSLMKIGDMTIARYQNKAEKVFFHVV